MNNIMGQLNYSVDIYAHTEHTSSLIMRVLLEREREKKKGDNGQYTWD